VYDEPSPGEAFEFLLGDEESPAEALPPEENATPLAHGLDDPDLDDFFNNLK
jgi:hypothetical protein